MNTRNGFAIRYDGSSFSVSSGGVIAGKVAIQVAVDLIFPEMDWWDFPFIVADWWLKEVRESDRQDALRLRFMDGPAECVLTGHDVMLVQCRYDDKIDNDFADKLVRVPRVQVDQALTRYAKELLDLARTRRWDTPDVQHLRMRLAGG